MSNFCDVIRKTIQSQPLTFDGAPYESAMDALYTLYSAHHPIDDAPMREGFAELERQLSRLSLGQRNRVFRLICDIYSADEREAFLQGLRFGFLLAEELKPEDQRIVCYQ